MSALDKAGEAYWNAFRDGFARVGGDPKEYPTWKQGRDPATKAIQKETLRCLRFAMEELKPFWGKDFNEIFPEPLAKRSSARTINDDLMAGKVKK